MSKIDNEAFEWIVRKRARGLNDAELAAFDAWHAADIRHKGAYARAVAIHNAIHLATGDQPIEEESDVAPAANGASFGRRQLLFGGMAAGLAIMAGIPVYSSLSRKTVLVTAKGEFRRVPLQDKSIANINSGSRIELAFNEQQRRVELRKGEAWFEVAKDKSKPFIVAAGDARIRAVGTAFSVRRLAGGSEVLVTEGTVEVWSEDGTAQRRLVTAGERAFLAKDAKAIPVTSQPAEVSRKLAWREGKLVLKNQTLGEAVADFNRYSLKTIVILDSAILERRLVGHYQLNAPELFAKDVSMVLDVPVVITTEKIMIGRAQGSLPGKA